MTTTPIAHPPVTLTGAPPGALVVAGAITARTEPGDSRLHPFISWWCPWCRSHHHVRWRRMVSCSFDLRYLERVEPCRHAPRGRLLFVGIDPLCDRAARHVLKTFGMI